MDETLNPEIEDALGDLIARLDDAAARLPRDDPMAELFKSRARELIDHGAHRTGRIAPEPAWPAGDDAPQTLLAGIAQSYAYAIGAMGEHPIAEVLKRQGQEFEAQVAGA